MYVAIILMFVSDVFRLVMKIGVPWKFMVRVTLEDDRQISSANYEYFWVYCIFFLA